MPATIPKEERERSLIVKEVLLHRRSVRQFSEEKIERQHLLDILEAAIYAPSGSNSQNQRFLVVEDKEELEALGRHRFIWPYPTAGQMRAKRPAGLIGGAAVAIVVFADASLTDGRDIGEYYIWESLEIQNCAASIENMLNMATALGIGSCWLSAGERMSRTRLVTDRSWAEVLASYDVPETYKIQGIVILGHPRAALDQHGYPRGEKEHGATHWQKTNRRTIDHYLVKRRDLSRMPPIVLSRLDRANLRIASMVSRGLLHLMKRVDAFVHDIEIKRALKDMIANQVESKDR